MPASRVPAQIPRSSSKSVNGDERAEVGQRRGDALVPGFEAGAALGEGQLAQVVALVDEEIVKAHVGRVVAHHARRDDLAVEALLQVVEGRDGAGASDEQLAVDHGRSGDGGEGRRDLGERRGDLVAGAREQARFAAGGRDLHAHAVPFPFGGDLVRREVAPVAFLDRMREHERAEDRLVLVRGFLSPAFEPGEEIHIGLLDRVPDFLDVAHGMPAHVGERLLGEAGRDADARGAGEQLQQRPAAARIEAVEHRREQRAEIFLRRGREGGNHHVERQISFTDRARRPHQRNRLGGVADEVTRQRIENRIDAAVHDLGEQAPQRQAGKQAVGRARPAHSRARDRACRGSSG